MQTKLLILFAGFIMISAYSGASTHVWAATEYDDDEYEYHGRHRHDGLIFRYSLGGAFKVFREGDVGGGISTEIVLGRSITDNVTLATTSSIQMITWSQAGATDSSSTLDYSHLNYLQCIEVNYFFMPTNVWIGAAIGMGIMSISAAVKEGEKQNEGGLSAGLRLSMGKEWWVSDNWGLGLMGVFLATTSASLTGAIENGEHFIGPAFTGSLQFTVTYQ